MMKTSHFSRIEESTMTLGRLLQQNAAGFGNRKAALRLKSRGIWQETGWQQYYETAAHMALGLMDAGLSKGEIVGILGRNTPSTLYALIASSSCGGIPVCLHQDSTAAEIANLIRKLNIRYMVVENQEQVDKLTEDHAPVSHLRKIIYCSNRGMRDYRDVRLSSMETLLAGGREQHEKSPKAFDDLIGKVSSADTALICLTSGASGEQKGALISHRGILSAAAALADATKMNNSMETVSFQPFSWIGELTISLASALLVGFTVNFPENSETVMEDLREIGPHIIHAPPDTWSTIASSVQIRMKESSPFKKFMYRTFIKAGERIADLRLSGAAPGPFARIGYAASHLLLVSALRDRLGLSRTIIALTGDSPLGRDAFRFFHSIGINLRQVYSLTEMSGVVAIHQGDSIKVESSGTLMSGTQAMFTSQGELLLKGDSLFNGYIDDVATDEALSGSWFHTGDAGFIDPDGHLIITDRLDSLITLENGSSIAPQPLESCFRFSPYIKEAVVVGRSQKFIAAIICIDGRFVGKWAGDCKINYTGYCDLSSKPEVYDLISGEMERINRSLPEKQRVRRFTLLYKDLHPDDGEISRSGKLRRALVENRYAEIILALYRGDESIMIDKTVELGDGKCTRLQSRLFFRNLP